ncbi:MAG: virulence factor Pgp3 [Terrimicrobiaceae bacterium]|nr:virulence factor Pgp3 [Terrimicrobiaceae bacterium]
MANLVLALFGELTKTVVDGRVVWSQPCSTSLPFNIYGVIPLEGEGLLCYIIRALKAVPGIFSQTIAVFPDAAARLLAVPEYTGQLGVEEDTGTLWIAASLTAGDWEIYTATGTALTFADAAARAAATPLYIGQLATQQDTGKIYIGTSLVAGGWTLFATLPGNLEVTTAMLAALGVTAEKLANTLDLSGKTSVVLPGEAISGRDTIDLLADVDYFLVWDASDPTHLKKVARTSVGVTPVGSVIQTVYAENAVHTALSTVIPWDDTVPQTTEGTAVLSATITPSSSTNPIIISVSGFGEGNGNAIIFALFQNTDTSAIFATALSYISGVPKGIFSFVFQHSPGVITPTLYTLRVGGDSGATYLNGLTAGRKLGGAARTTMLVQEIKG